MAKANAHWPNLKRVYRSNSALVLAITKIPPGHRLEAEFTVVVQDGAGNEKKKKTATLALVGDRDPASRKDIKKLESIELDGEPLAHSPPEDAPWFRVRCCSRFKGRWRLIPGADVFVPGLWADHDDNGDKAEYRVYVSIQLKRGNGGEAKAFGVEKKFELCSRRMTLSRKLEAFLAWQNDMVYGPPDERYSQKHGSYILTRRHWGNLSGDENKYFLRVAATGKETHGIVCSPMVALFLAYWFNLHQYYKPKSGSSAEEIEGHFEPFLEKVQPKHLGAAACQRQHRTEWTKVGRDKGTNKMFKWLVKQTSEEKPVAELNAIAGEVEWVGRGKKKKRKYGPKQVGTCFRVTGEKGVLDRPLQAPSKQRLSSQNEVHAGDVVMWSRHNRRWVLLYRQKAIKCCTQKTGKAFRFHWRAFFDYLEMEKKKGKMEKEKREMEEEKGEMEEEKGEGGIRPGAVFVCASGSHAWLVVYLGKGCTVPQKYIFGPQVDLPDEPCEDGYYLIQANGPGPAPVLYSKYRLHGDLLKDEHHLRIEDVPEPDPNKPEETKKAERMKRQTLEAILFGPPDQETDSPENGNPETTDTQPREQASSAEPQLAGTGGGYKENTAMSAAGISFIKIFEHLEDKYEAVINGVEAEVSTKYSKLTGSEQKVVFGIPNGLFVYNATKLYYMNGQIREPSDTEKGRKGYQLVVDFGVLPKANEDAIRRKDPEYGLPKGFNVWRVYPSLNTEPSDGNIGWVNPRGRDLGRWPRLPEHDCRPLEKV